MHIEMGTMLFQMIMMAFAGLFPLLLVIVAIWLAWRLVKAQESMASSLSRIAEGGLVRGKGDDDSVAP